MSARAVESAATRQVLAGVRGKGGARSIGIDVGALHRYDSKQRFMAALNIRLYLDDSGKPDKGPFFAIGGYVSPEKQWRQFARQWQQALDDADIDEFHATDFFSRFGESNQRGGRYQDKEAWPDEKHLRFSRRFTAIAEKYTMCGVGRGVHVSAYQDLVLPEPLFRVGTANDRFTPVMFCVQTCLEHIAKTLASRMPPGEEIAVVIEQGEGVGQVGGVALGEVTQWCQYLKRRTSWGFIYGTFTTGSKSILPLQAADLLVHETGRRLKERINPTGRPIRKSFQRLLKSKTVSIGMGTREQFARGIELIKLFSKDPLG